MGLVKRFYFVLGIICYSISLIRSGLWTAYGLMVTDYSLIVINIIGAVFQSSYFILYYFYSENLVSIINVIT